MYKIKKIKFDEHPILKDLELNFCDSNGKAVDTVILAGENGTGKSTIIKEIFNIVSNNIHGQCSLELENDETNIHLVYSFINSEIWVTDNSGLSNPVFFGADKIGGKYHFKAIYSDVDINFHSKRIENVTSLTLDSEIGSRKSSSNLPNLIKQLLIDIQALDDAEVANAARNNSDKTLSQLNIEERMTRFRAAFDRMFDELSYSRVANMNNSKQILFKKNGVEIPIDDLSSGEKQIVYRGCFLLKDINAMDGAFVFIDEPEISLHPLWQQKIMDYYKGIFTNQEGKQTSQIFAVTHSPFIIHNENRKNDKVIVLARNEQGEIVVKDKPEYFKCNSVEAVEDAFSIHDFSPAIPTVYLEGRTDEKYFNKAIEVFGYDVPFKFKWVGYIGDNGQEVNTGSGSLDKAFHFLAAQNLDQKNICLKDCDTKTNYQERNNVIRMSIKAYDNSKGMKKGIENALILDDIDLSPYYEIKEKEGDYGGIKTEPVFKKMECCDFICSKDNETLKKVFAHLKEVIDMLIEQYNEEQ